MPALDAHAEHLLKKDLLSRQLRTEISRIVDDPNTLAALVPPDATPRHRRAAAPAAAVAEEETQDPRAAYPLLAPLFARIVMTFPPSRIAGDDGGEPGRVWGILGRFLGSLARVDSAGGTARDVAKRDIIANRMVDQLAAMLGCAVLTAKEKEAMGAGIDVSGSRTCLAQSFSPGTLELKLEVIEVAVRVVRKKKLLSTSETLEYGITSLLNGRPAQVWRDAAAFKALHKELVRRPKTTIPPLPTLESHPPARTTSPEALNRYLTSLATPLPSAALLDLLGQAEPVDTPDPSGDATLRRAEDIQKALETFRDDLISPGGVARLLAIVAGAAEVGELPAHVGLVVEWWRICGAAALHRTFIEHERAPEHLRRLKQFHNRAPYKGWTALLKGTNPIMVIKAIGNLILARPFGGKCLLQSMICSVIDDEAHRTAKEIARVEALFTGDEAPACCARARALVVDAPVGGYDDDAHRDLAAEVLGFSAAVGSPERAMAEKLLELHWRVRRNRQFRSIVVQDVTVDLAKELLSISYKPLAEAYKATDPGSFVRDLAHFFDDLIRVVEAEHKRASEIADPANSTPDVPPLRPFINLISRYQQRIYHLVRSAISTHPSKLTALSEIAAWAEDLAHFFRGVDPAIDLDPIFGPHDSGPALARDVAKLAARKELRRRRVADRILGRVRGETRGTSLMDGVEREGIEEGVLSTDDEARAAKVLEAELRKMWGEEGQVAAPVAPELADDLLGVPAKLGHARHPSFNSLLSIDSVGSEGGAGGDSATASTATLGEADVEARVMSLFAATEAAAEAEADAPAEPEPAPMGPAANGFGIGQKVRRREWRDPLGLEVAPALVAPWIDAMGPWLDNVANGK
ncbi:hypothetical protein BDK51DRAFT_28481 [Blyttiomyces helicus]|uniref:PX-associated-domain-containing protein n=1 Tax=Blyttiomyces helicus TaxID=388810 RepID=A0A4P9WKV2_9FUNG|nr:hypothetical protein BDK51DRAFT_28481 [Blyttiomyces helicus]|eukprot:RKO92663.1 hypothetical protein BDK51DRAFT_28481 [Blyttiomyces helicus]